MTIRLEASLKKRVMELAKAERRRFNAQVIFLMEKGLAELEQKQAPAPEVTR
jgi:predicted transcriptional regulator